MDDKVWDHAVFSKNRDRLLEGEVSHRFFAQGLSQAEEAELLSKEHFSVDGTLIEALASHKSYRPKDNDGPPGGGGRNPTVDFHGERTTRHPGYATSQMIRKRIEECFGWAKTIGGLRKSRVWTPPRLQALRSLAGRFDCARVSGL